jgi:hypothetical protein
MCIRIIINKEQEWDLRARGRRSTADVARDALEDVGVGLLRDEAVVPADGRLHISVPVKTHVRAQPDAREQKPQLHQRRQRKREMYI